MDITTVVDFATARHAVWEGKPVDDPILRNRKFTNVFRVIDRGSQYLVQLMNTHTDPLDRLAVAYFYRQVNRPDTMGDIIVRNKRRVPGFKELVSPAWYDKVVAPVVASRPGAFLNGAYIILIKPGDSRGTVDKMREMFPAAGPYLRFVAAEPHLAGRVKLLNSVPGIGPFLAMQIATDMGYCEGEPDQENDFILAGPGSRNGVKFISDKPAETVIKTFPVDLLPPLPYSNGRNASWMDVQNVFCEFSKYARLLTKGYKDTGRPYQKSAPFELEIPDQFILARKTNSNPKLRRKSD